MNFLSFFGSRERFVGIDIGAAAVKLVELEMTGDKMRLKNAAAAPLGGDIFAGNTIVKRDQAAAEVARLLAANGVTDRRAVTAVPGPSVFVKRIKVPDLPPAELAPTVFLEAGSLVPHNLDAVKLDFQVVGRADRTTLDVLLVAVKRDVIESFTGCLDDANLTTAIVDVDVFALQNAFEASRPELRAETVALVHVGARYTSVALCAGGASLFTGDAPIGGRACTEALARGLGKSFDEAEALKCGAAAHDAPEVKTIVDRWVDGAAAELNRQLGLFLGASGHTGGIDRVLVSGGGAKTAGFLEALARKTELPCEPLSVFRGIHREAGVDEAALAEIEPLMGVALGLALRRTGDKPRAEI